MNNFTKHRKTLADACHPVIAFPGISSADCTDLSVDWFAHRLERICCLVADCRDLHQSGLPGFAHSLLPAGRQTFLGCFSDRAPIHQTGFAVPARVFGDCRTTWLLAQCVERPMVVRRSANCAGLAGAPVAGLGGNRQFYPASRSCKGWSKSPLICSTPCRASKRRACVPGWQLRWRVSFCLPNTSLRPSSQMSVSLPTGW